MPSLPAEPDFYPPDLWGELDDRTSRWWCLHAKPRQEKAIGRDLRALRIGYYLPQAVQLGRTPQGRPTRSVIPLFPGYLFLYGTEKDRLASLRSNRLVRVIDVVDQADLIHDLGQIQRVLTSGVHVAPEPSYPVGTRVKVLSGPLAGIVGIVVRRAKRERFTAIVHFLKQGATVDLEDWRVEPISDAQSGTQSA
jgi:transcriptional antiterminator RfaH